MSTTQPQSGFDYDTCILGDVYDTVVEILRRNLPGLDNPTPQAIAARERAAIAQVASLVPANAFEANLAARCIATGAHADQCLGDALLYDAADPARARQCRAQAASMERASRGQFSALLRAQAAREKRESNPATLNQAARIEHCALGLLRQSLEMQNPLAALPEAELASPVLAPDPSEVPEPSILPVASDPSEPPPPPSPTPATRSTHNNRAPWERVPADPPRDLAAEASYYAAVYPRRAQEIRQYGGVPPNCTYGPPDDDLAHEIATSTDPELIALDAPAALDSPAVA